MKEYLTSIKTGVTVERDYIPSPNEPPPPTPEEAAAAALAAWRATATCTAMQGQLALGPDLWAAVEAYRDDPATTWQERVIINSASEWNRNSQNIAFFAYLLGLTDAEVDDLFRAAQEIEA